MSAHEQRNKPIGYDQDFYAWATEQAALLRTGRVSELDLTHLAEEVETLGGAEQRELVNRLSVLLLHLLKWSFQPERRSTSWRLTIEEQRRQIARHLKRNPSLKSWQDQAIADGYGDAILRAEYETGLLRDMFPWSCPYTLDDMLDDTFWPEPREPDDRTRPA